jgi:hypothetical protein
MVAPSLLITYVCVVRGCCKKKKKKKKKKKAGMVAGKVQYGW